MNRIESYLRLELERLNNENILYVIIFGSVASGKVSSTSDIDILVVFAGQPSEVDRSSIDSVYFDMHERFSFVPDYKYKAEICDKPTLLKSLSFLQNYHFNNLKVTESMGYDAMIWMSAHCTDSIFIYGNYDEFQSVRNYCFSVSENVKGSLIESQKRMKIDRLLRRIVKVEYVRA